MSEQSPRLELPFIQPAQAQKHVTHNEAIELLDALVQLRLEDIDLNDPPVAPDEGAAWSVGPMPTNGWIGHDGDLATWRNNGWLFITPKDGWCAWVANEDRIFVFETGAWTPLIAEVDLQNIAGIGINTTSDAARPLSISGPASLFNHAGSSHRVTINKASAGNTASVMYQNGFSGRAEIGLVGADDLAIKTSEDGTNWVEKVVFSSTRTKFSDTISVDPGTTPATADAGDIYFDAITNKLRCYDGTSWNDLF